MKCELCKLWLVSIIILGIGFYIAYQFVPASAPRELRIATGSKEGAYYQYALQYQKKLQAEALQLDIQPTAGSLEALQLLEEKKVDVAFIQGGVASSVPDKNTLIGLHSIASLFYEPLWIFYRKDMPLNHLYELRGKRLGIGKEGSGTQVLANQLLGDNGVNADNTLLLTLSSDETEKKLLAGEIDAGFFVMSPKVDMISKLANHPDLALMNFHKQIRAYTSHYPFLNAIVLDEGMLDLKNNIPNHEVVLLATTAALVASKDIYAEHVRLFSREALTIHSQAGLLEKAKEFPSIEHLEIPIHPDAEKYLLYGPPWLEKVLPFWLAAKIDQLKVMLIPLLTLLLPLIKGVLPLYQWRIRSRTYRWYKALNDVDRQLDGFNLSEVDLAIERLTRLHSDLAKEISVPLSYMSDFYSLRMHLDYILKRLREKKGALTSKLVSFPKR